MTQPIALRDPYRLSHYDSEEYRGLWADAGAYLDTLKANANTALTDWAILGWQEYSLAIDQAVTSAMGGTDPKAALDQAVSDMNAISDRLGRDAQIEQWNSYLQTPARRRTRRSRRSASRHRRPPGVMRTPRLGSG